MKLLLPYRVSDPSIDPSDLDLETDLGARGHGRHGQVGDLDRPDLVLADVEVGDRRSHEGRGVTRHPGMKKM